MRRDSNPAGSAPRLRAVLFDFNGVLMDDETLHYRAFRRTLAPLGVRLTRRLYDERYLASDDRTACAAALRDAGVAPAARTRRAVAALVVAKRRLHRALCRERGAGVEEGARRLVRALAARLRLAVVSSAARAEVIDALRRARILGAFTVIVAAEDVRRPKPHPEGYRRALRRLGGGRRRGGPGAGFVAIEDSPGGIAAARAAGLRVLGVATTYRAAALRRAGAYAVVGSLADPGRVLRRLGVQKAS